MSLAWFWQNHLHHRPTSAPPTPHFKHLQHITSTSPPHDPTIISVSVQVPALPPSWWSASPSTTARSPSSDSPSIPRRRWWRPRLCWGLKTKNKLKIQKQNLDNHIEVDHPGLHSDRGALQRGVVHTHNPRALWLRFPCWQSGNQLTSVWQNVLKPWELKNTPGDLRHSAVQPANLEADVHKPQPTDCSDYLIDHGVTQVFPNYCHCCSNWYLWRHQQTFTHHNSKIKPLSICKSYWSWLIWSAPKVWRSAQCWPQRVSDKSGKYFTNMITHDRNLGALPSNPLSSCDVCPGCLRG